MNSNAPSPIFATNRVSRYAAHPVRRLWVAEINRLLQERLRDIQISFSSVLIVGEGDNQQNTEETYDLVLQVLSLHTSNDFEGDLARAYDKLNPDGLFLAVLPAVDSFSGAREALMEAEHTCTGGAALRFHPMIQPERAVRAMQEVGFVLPVIDVEKKTLHYPAFLSLLRDIRHSGEGIALVENKRPPLTRRVLEEADRLYREKYAAPEGGVLANLSLLFLHGWKPPV